MKSTLGLLSIHFANRRDQLVREHRNEYVLIYKFEEVAFFETGVLAYQAAIEKKLPPGEFSIFQCIPKEEERPVIFHSRVEPEQKLY